MAKKRIQQSDQEIALRAISHARQIEGRLFASREGVFLVRGDPAFRKLFHCLSTCQEPPLADQAPTPAALGFPLSETVPLSSSALGTWARALQKWRKILDDYERPRQKTAERRRKYRTWGQEIETLSCRLAQFQEVLREASGVPGNAPYVLPAAEEATFQSILNGASGDGVEDPLWKWLAHVVAWIAGVNAGLRFLVSLSPYYETAEEYSQRLAFRRFDAALEQIYKRESDFTNREMLLAVQSAFDKAPGYLLLQAGIKRPSRARNVSPFFPSADVSPFWPLDDPQRASLCGPPLPLVAGAAALCATDGAEAPVPRCMLALGEPESVEKRQKIFRTLADESRNPSYDLLLRSLDSLADVTKCDVEVLRKFLVSGVDIKDAEWADKALRWEADEYAAKGLDPKPLKRLCTRLIEMGAEEKKIDPTDLAEKVVERGGTDLLDAFADWVDLLDSKALTPSLALSIWHTLNNLLVLEKALPAFRDGLRKWSIPQDEKLPWTFAREDLSREAISWLGRLAHYQRLSGQAVALPKSLEQLLKRQERESKELEYLRGAKEQGRLNGSQAARLTLLENRPQASSAVDERKLVRQSQEVCAKTALDAVKFLARRNSLAYWASAFGNPPPEYLSDDEVIGISAWITGLSSKPAQHVRELIEAWRAHGPDYRGHLHTNRRWIESVEASGLNVASWLAPPSIDIQVAGTTIRVEVSRDPFRTFLMGSYFDTCLSLDSFNKDSVLANAYDANKSVVFAFGPEGEILGRKLVCVSTRHELIGYRTYVASTDKLSEAQREQIGNAVAAFCGRWASTLGLSLGFTGRPAKISGLFWYDDGLETWKPAAHAAFEHQEQNIQDILESDFSGLAPELVAALKDREAECIEILQRLDICPLSEDGSSKGLHEATGLAEETLAFLARREQQPELARSVFRHARTSGGRLEAMTSRGLLEGDKSLSEILEWLRTERHDRCAVERLACVLRDLDSPDAWDKLAWLVLNEDDMRNASALWLLLGAHRPDVVEALKKNIPYLRKTYRLSIDDVFLIVASVLSQRHVFPDGLIRAILTADNDARTAFGLAQWLPPLEEPKGLIGALLAELLKTETCGEEERAALMNAAVTVALGNPGTDSTRLLKKQAAEEPAALLALALLEPRRFRKSIERSALSMKGDPAALVALLRVLGKDDARQLLQESFRDTPGQMAQFESACQLLSAYQALDLSTAAALLDPPYSLHVGNTFPVLLEEIWRAVRHDAPDIDAIKRLTSDGKALRRIFDTNGIGMSGLAVRLAHILGTSGNSDQETLLQALQNVLNNMRSHYAEFLVPLDALSGYRAFSNAKAHEYKIGGLDDILACGACASLILDENGNPRPWLELADWSDAYGCSFPPDPFGAKRLVDFLIQRAQWKDPFEALEPATEIQKRLTLGAASRGGTGHLAS